MDADADGAFGITVPKGCCGVEFEGLATSVRLQIDANKWGVREGGGIPRRQSELRCFRSLQSWRITQNRPNARGRCRRSC